MKRFLLVLFTVFSAVILCGTVSKVTEEIVKHQINQYVASSESSERKEALECTQNALKVLEIGDPSVAENMTRQAKKYYIAATAVQALFIFLTSWLINRMISDNKKVQNSDH